MRDIAAERADMDAKVAGWTIPKAFAAATDAHPDSTSVEWREDDGTWHALTRREYRELVRDLALGLAEMGFAPGEFGMVMGPNRLEHAAADLAVIHARGSSVSLYSTLAPDQVAWIAGHCGGTLAFVDDESYLAKFREVKDQLPRLRTVVLMRGEPAEDADWVVRWDDLLAAGRKVAEGDPEAFDRLWQQIEPDDLLSLIYTSGTTGTPKGVMYTHHNILWTAESMARLFGRDVLTDTRLVSYLPLAHVSERFTSHWAPIWYAVTLGTEGSVAFCPDINQVLLYLLEKRPTVFVGVPRVWEKFQAAIRAGAAAEPDPERRAMVQEALEVGRAVALLEHEHDEVPADLRDKRDRYAPVYEAVRGRLGLDRCRFAVTTTAPTPLDLELFFAGIGVPLLEVWGMSELSGPATAVPREHVRYGTCGPTIPGVEARRGEDGELLIRGGNVMAGYYKLDEETTATIDADGWLHSGDIAQVDDEGFWRIVDRKKELIITSSGKNIAPAQVESLLKMHPLVGQAIVVGDNRNYLTAVITLDPEMAPLWAARNGIGGASLEELAKHPDVVATVREGVHAANAHLARIEQVKRITLVADQWTPDSGHLTPTQKMRRRVVHDHYEDVIDSMYADPPAGIEIEGRAPAQP